MRWACRHADLPMHVDAFVRALLHLLLGVWAVGADRGLRQMLGVVMGEPQRPWITFIDVLILRGHDAVHRRGERLRPWWQQRETDVMTKLHEPLTGSLGAVVRDAVTGQGRQEQTVRPT